MYHQAYSYVRLPREGGDPELGMGDARLSEDPCGHTIRHSQGIQVWHDGFPVHKKGTLPYYDHEHHHQVYVIGPKSPRKTNSPEFAASFSQVLAN